MLPLRLRLATLSAALLLSARLFAGPVSRPEFPNPQFERRHWLTLNGDWDFSFDDNDAGLTSRWYSQGLPSPRHISVPYCFESKLSGIGDTALHPISWYQRSIRLPADWNRTHVLLHFGAVYYQASVW